MAINLVVYGGGIPHLKNKLLKNTSYGRIKKIMIINMYELTLRSDDGLKKVESRQ